MILVILVAIRLGRLTALRKPNGGVRGIAAGDIVRSPWFNSSQRERKKPQHRSNTLCEQGRAEDDRATVAVDGIGAFDLISRQAMLSGLRDREYGEIDAIRQRISWQPSRS